ncbi:hypothetical protein FQA47_015368 [Oryzias melastigma]|uniref:Ig-like domain-containing protein n=1 Tax=Oryzias melastigma TaxID=30732 RepID=A0A834F6L6_ORYME|nr:hypothetical protein FQA47_015368 [Oryzias melastigma]
MGILKRNFGCGAIFCFIFTVGVVVSKLELLTSPSVEAKCGDNLTLKCEVNSIDQTDLTITKFEWMHKTSCEDISLAKTGHGLYCQIQNKTALFGTLINIMPEDEGEYICKMHSNHGIKNEKTNVKVNCCFGSSKITGNGSHLTCQFKGVYPSASVLWFQNNTITANSTIQKTEGGLYDYSSSISLDEGNRDQPYSCVLSRSSPCPDVKLQGNRGAIKLQRNTFVIEMTMMMMTFMW